MGTIFFKVIEMSTAAVMLMIAVVFIRIPLKKAPKWFMGLLWAIVALRLMVPVQITAHVGFMPDFGNVIENFFSNDEVATKETADLTDAPIAISGGIYDTMDITNKSESLTTAPEIADQSNAQAELLHNEADKTSVTDEGIPAFCVVIWLIGMLGVLAYGAFSYIVIKRKTSASIRYISGERIYVCDEIDTPFIFGVFKPAIYMPSGLDARTIKNVLVHEKAHLQRFDHIRKQLGFMILAVHWFNPLVWLSYILFCRDIELACDERVIARMNLRQKRSYAKSLLDCSTGRRLVFAYPLAFGEVGVGTRVRQIFNYKRPTAWLVTLLIVVCGALSICSFTKAAEKVVVVPFPLEALDELEQTTSESTKVEVTLPAPIVWEAQEIVERNLLEQEKQSGITNPKEDGVVNLPYTEGTRNQADNMPHNNGDEAAVYVNEGNEAVGVSASNDTVNVSVKDGNENINVSANKNDPVVKEAVGVAENVLNDLDKVISSDEDLNKLVNDSLDHTMEEVQDEVIDEIFDELDDEGIRLFGLFP